MKEFALREGHSVSIPKPCTILSRGTIGDTCLLRIVMHPAKQEGLDPDELDLSKQIVSPEDIETEHQRLVAEYIRELQLLYKSQIESATALMYLIKRVTRDFVPKSDSVDESNSAVEEPEIHT